MNNKPNLIDIPTKSREIFFYFVGVCNEQYRSGEDLDLYKKIIKEHRKSREVDELITSGEFHLLLYQTLEKWNMNQRGAKLVDFATFSNSITLMAHDISELQEHKLTCVKKENISKILKILERVFISLKVMQSKRRIVGVSKTLHFLLPDLVMPIDGKYTMISFFGYNKYASEGRQEFLAFGYIIDKSMEIVKKLKLKTDDVKGGKWNTSIPKLIDNAIIGFNRTLEIYFKQFGSQGIERFLTKCASFAEFTASERDKYRHMVRKCVTKLETSKRQEIEKKLLRQKAEEAGITVSEEEIDAELSRQGKVN